MLPERTLNLWTDLNHDRDRSLDEVVTPSAVLAGGGAGAGAGVADFPSALHSSNASTATASTTAMDTMQSTHSRTLSRSGPSVAAAEREHMFKEELELNSNHAMLAGAAAAAVASGGTTSGRTSALGMHAETAEAIRHKQQRWTRRWYLLVIVLLYVGLLASFSLNVSLLLRRPSAKATAAKPGAGVTQLQDNTHAAGGAEKVLRFHDSHQGLGDQLQPPYDNRVPLSSSQLAGSGEHGAAGYGGAAGYAYTTSCLVKDPCESGHYWNCDLNECTSCPKGFYQPQWGQTSCLPCPFNTTTDFEGAKSPTECKRHNCPFYTKDGFGILESPNFPGEYPANAECHWRIRPGRNKRLLVIISSVQLDSECEDSLIIRKTERSSKAKNQALNVDGSDSHDQGEIFSTCDSHEEPIIFTGHSRNLWVDFVAAGNDSGRGFQISFLTIEDELGYLVDAIVREDKIDSFDKRPQNEMSLDDKRLLSRLLLLLNSGYPSPPLSGQRNRRPTKKKKPIINVVIEEAAENASSNDQEGLSGFSSDPSEPSEIND